MGKHTPGPWTTVRVGKIIVSIAPLVDGEPANERFDIARVHFPNYHPDGLEAAQVENDANAHLIAAAPDLLAALKRFAHAMEQTSYPELQGIWTDANHAIAKAERTPTP